MAKKRQHERNKETRDKIAARWSELRTWCVTARPPVCCGGHGLVVGCPDCGKRRKS